MYSLFAVLCILAMALIFVIGVQPPNAMALNITIGFLALTGVVWGRLKTVASKVRPLAT